MERVAGSDLGSLVGGPAGEGPSPLREQAEELTVAWEGVPPRVARYLLGLGEAMVGPADAYERRVGLVRALLAVRERFDGGDHALLSQLSQVGKWLATGPSDRPAVVGRLARLQRGVLRTPLLDEVFAAGLDALTLHERLEALEAAGRSRGG